VAGKFNPSEFNADEWIRAAKEAGMGYFVITAKHHDGFCLYDTKLTDYRSKGPTGQAFEGHGVDTWNPEKKVYQSWWFDNMSPTGMLMAGRLVDISQMALSWKQIADELGLPLEQPKMTYNTRFAQEMAKWAESKGRGDEFHDAVFRAYFVDGKNIGLLQLKKEKKGFFSEEDVKSFEALAQDLALALAHRHAQVDLRERVKELECLYDIAHLAKITAVVNVYDTITNHEIQGASLTPHDALSFIYTQLRQELSQEIVNSFITKIGKKILT
jgi:hypothetical protein